MVRLGPVGQTPDQRDTEAKHQGNGTPESRIACRNQPGDGDPDSAIPKGADSDRRQDRPTQPHVKRPRTQREPEKQGQTQHIRRVHRSAKRQRGERERHREHEHQGLALRVPHVRHRRAHQGNDTYQSHVPSAHRHAKATAYHKWIGFIVLHSGLDHNADT
jgi:hypothetical protein